MSGNESVILEFKKDIATIILNRPSVHNAFDEAKVAALSSVFDELAARDDVKAVLVKGEGKSFCAGADMNWMKRAANFTPEENERDALALAQMLDKFYNLPMITIAHVYGAAFGGGIGLVSCADVVVADETAKFALSEVKVGLIPATISPYVIRAMGPRHAKRYFQTGERFDGRKAYDMGLVHDYADRPEDAEYIVHTILNNIAANGPQAMRESKRLFEVVQGREIDKNLMQETAQKIAKIRCTDEAKEGLGAFLEKRKPNWTS